MGMTKQTVTEKKKATACKKRNVIFRQQIFDLSNRQSNAVPEYEVQKVCCP